MRPTAGYWQIYRRDRIKPELHGRLIFVLEIPQTPGYPIRRHVFDPSGMEFPSRSRQSITALLAQKRRGVIFDGVSKAAVYNVMLAAPKLLEADPQLLLYNQSMVRNSCHFFLSNPDPETGDLPQEATVGLAAAPTTTGLARAATPP